MMLVFDNIVYSLQRSGGVSRFWAKITEPYLGRAQFLERDDATSNLYRREQQPAHRLPDHRLFKTLSRYVDFRLSFDGAPHIFHSSYYRLNRARNALNVTTIHDLIYERFGSGVGSRLHIAQKRRSLAAADCIVCVSEHTRADLYEYYPFTREKRVLVIPNGVDAIQPSTQPDAISNAVQSAIDAGDYFLYVGHRGSCKGFDRVYEALRLSPGWRCVVVGGALEAQELADIRAAGLEGRVVAAGRVSDAELTLLYSRAGFFFFPSLYEGFGIPPLEAMQQGCPVLASNRSSVPEVVGDAGVLFDPDKRASLEEGLEKIKSAAARARLVQSGLSRAALFSWSAAVDQYRALYAELLHGH